MINIRITTKNDLIEEIIIDGHSNYDEYGKDIVCSAVSAITIGTINALIKLVNKNTVYAKDDGYALIKFEKDNSSQIIAQTMIIQLKSIEDSYKEFLKIIYS